MKRYHLRSVGSPDRQKATCPVLALPAGFLAVKKCFRLSSMSNDLLRRLCGGFSDRSQRSIKTVLTKRSISVSSSFADLPLVTEASRERHASRSLLWMRLF
jgi:hypothetical protein